MSDLDFFSEKGRLEARDAIAAIEEQTSAEVVMQVRHFGGRYRDADYLWGLVTALLALIAMLYAKRNFPLIGFPVQVAVAFGLGALISSHIAPLRRIFTRQRYREAEVHRAARSSFYDHGVARTSGRWGILVFVSTFEKRVEVVADVGIDTAALGSGWTNAIVAMEAALARHDFAQFMVALRSLGPVLAAKLPHHADDVDELPNYVAADEEGV